MYTQIHETIVNQYQAFKVAFNKLEYREVYMYVMRKILIHVSHISNSRSNLWITKGT